MRDFVRYSIWALVGMLGATLLCFLMLRFIRFLEFALGAASEWGGDWAVAAAFCFIFAPILGMVYLLRKKLGVDDYFDM